MRMVRSSRPSFRPIKHPIHAKQQERDAAGDLVRQIRVPTLEYAPPGDACTSFKALYEARQEFEADLHQHIHLDNNVHLPRAVDLEAAVTGEL